MIQNIWEKIYLIDSWIIWKTTTIMAWVHWNEFIWIKVLEKVLEKIKINYGKVYFVIANLEAIKIDKREFEKNMNRCFLEKNDWKTYEDKRAKKIIKVLEKSDYLLDLHNTFSKENSVKFLISEYKDLGDLFDVPYVISWFDELHPWWSDGFMNNIWKKAVCLESGSLYDISWEKWLKELVEKSIYNFLKFTWNIDWRIEKYKNKININFDYIYKNKTNNFNFLKKYKDFEEIQKGEIIAIDWKEKIFSQYNWYILFARNPNIIGEECFCLGKK